ncbi:hypothetical protein ACIQPQ_34520 [Streptomyces sp. NPDC091281]|uniref:hypothetical protein n=1 Tax=Streptomyces sp. NPDC091281 TaxID=3365985 RepID=UPI0037FC4C3E
MTHPTTPVPIPENLDEQTGPVLPTGPVHVRPEGFREFSEQATLLRDTLTAADVDLGAYESLIIDWLSRWEWATVAVIASWVTRAATARTPLPADALPSPFHATPAEVDQYLQQVLAEDTYLRYQQAIGGQAEAVRDLRERVDGADIPGSSVTTDYVKGQPDGADYVNPAKGGDLYPTQLQCSQHDGFAPCRGAPRCTSPGATQDGEES